MIYLFNFKTKVSVTYKNFEEVCDHFRRIEYLMPFNEEKAHNQIRWEFIYWTHKRLVSLYDHSKDKSFSLVEQEAYENGCDLIEVIHGYSEHPKIYVVTPDLDPMILMREWCFDYAYSNGYTILETFPHKLPQTSFLASHHTSQGLDYRDFQESFREGMQP